MRYLLIDRIVRLHRDKSILAMKNVTLAEDVFSDHFLGFPVMPGAAGGHRPGGVQGLHHR